MAVILVCVWLDPSCFPLCRQQPFQSCPSRQSSREMDYYGYPWWGYECILLYLFQRISLLLYLSGLSNLIQSNNSVVLFVFLKDYHDPLRNKTVNSLKYYFTFTFTFAFCVCDREREMSTSLPVVERCRFPQALEDVFLFCDGVAVVGIWCYERCRKLLIGMWTALSPSSPAV